MGKLILKPGQNEQYFLVCFVYHNFPIFNHRTNAHFMHQQWYVIANPVSGQGKAGNNWTDLQQKIASYLPVSDWAVTTENGHATELVKRAIAQGYRRILTVGGDGTNHEVANGILSQSAVRPIDIHHALLPAGTGNDWARTHSIPTKPDDALSMIAKGHTTLQDVGLINYQSHDKPVSRYFVNVAGLAYDGYLVQRSMQRKPGEGGKLFYLSLVTKCLFEYYLQEAVVEANGQSYQDFFYTINFGIGKYSGGGMQLVPHAEPDKGAFAVTLAGQISRLGVLMNTYRFYNGTISSHPKVTTFFAEEADVKATPGSPPTLLEADGEFLGETPAHFQIVPKALRIVVPA